MRLLKLIPDNTNIGFVRLRYWAFGITAFLTVLRGRRWSACAASISASISSAA